MASSFSTPKFTPDSSPKAEDTAATGNSPDQPTSGKGMPDKEPRAQRSRPGQQDTLKDGSVESSLELPHERDQARDMTSAHPDPAIEQAGKDVEAGRKDTSKAPEMDSTYRKL